ncbi:LexA family transcriptional regulator [Acinetobacter nosocomialis]|uniref:LexA family transcriptional regulator n=1 Tax=Acinetobacter nosocomialis TaxID=106654 RepID=UPI001AEA8876|nr:LexA family transcriptional regulator [Acinetobacter nosocomialis]MBP1470596.1 helix-turn-helix domain-containing protein [Acinetobacter nosocomialis]
MSELKTIHEIRLGNTRKLMKESGLTRSEFAEKIDMSYGLVSQYIGKNPTKNIGDETALKIEEAFNKPRGYLDQSDNQNENASQLDGTASFKQLDIEAFKKKYNIPDSEDAVLFSNVIEKPLVISKRWVPVKAYSKMGMDGYFTDMGYDGNAGDGYIPTHTAGDRSYAIKGTGDSMYPAIRNGWYVVCDPDAELTPTEFVQVCLKDGRCTIKEFIGIHNNVLNLLAVNGGERLTFDMDEVESITAITDIVPPSQHRQHHPKAH